MLSKKANVLIVEDDVSLRISASGILAESGYRVRSAEDGCSALVEIRNEIPDIILSNLNMPGMSGLELISVVRRWFPTIQIIATSGIPLGDDVQAYIRADALYIKEANPDSLLRIVEAMTRRTIGTSAVYLDS
jgi:CheY-like chemotaxis protein